MVVDSGVILAIPLILLTPGDFLLMTVDSRSNFNHTSISLITWEILQVVIFEKPLIIRQKLKNTQKKNGQKAKN